MIEMRADHDIFVLQHRIGAGNDAQHIGRAEGALGLAVLQADRHQLKPFLDIAARLHPQLGEAVRDKGGGLEIAIGDGVAPLQFIGGEKGDVLANAVAVKFHLAGRDDIGRSRSGLRP